MVIRDVTFMCGRAGVCALGAVVAKYMGDDQMLHYYLSKFKEVSNGALDCIFSLSFWLAPSSFDI